jgi:hypothetical protein
MRKLFLSFLSLSSLVATIAHAEVALSAHLDLVPDHALPAIPVVFVISLTNPNAASHLFHPRAHLTATRADGTSFRVLWEGTNEETYLDKEELVIAVGATAKLFVPVGELLMLNGAFFDARLCVPGTYDLQLEFSEEPIRTNLARLTVEDPMGVDRDFWNALLSSATDHSWNAGRWMSGKANAILDQFPATRYYNLLAWYHRHAEGPEAVLNSLRPALATGVSGPIGDDFRLLVAFSLGEIALESARHGSFAQIDSLLTEADSVLQPTISNPSTEYALVQANLQKQHLQGVAAQVTNLQSHTPYVAPKKLKVELKCREANGSIRFNVQNVNSTPRRVDLGAANGFDPQPIDRGQPVAFLPGKWPVSIPVLAGETTLTWRMEGASTTASLTATSPKPCTD